MTNKQVMKLMTELGLHDGGMLNWIKDNGWVKFARKLETLVRDDERKKCVRDYLQDTCNAIDLVRIEERQACIDIVETYRIPVGNSPQGELAADWTYAALHEIRDEIKARKDK